LFVDAFRPRIPLEVRARLELQWIHEDADGDFAVRARRVTRDPHQLEMPAMQRAHRRHQHASAAAAAA
jgi:hypothetical protein